MSRILFYVEPVTFRDNPLEMLTWTDWIEGIVRASKLAATGDHFGLVSSDALCGSLKSRLGDYLDWYLVAEQKDLLQAFEFDKKRYLKDLFLPESADAANPPLEALLRRAGEEFQPQVTFSFTQNRYLRAALEPSAILFTEMSPLLRKFTKHSLFFDPLGHQRESMLVTKLDEINAAPMAGETLAQLKDLFQTYFDDPVRFHTYTRHLSNFIRSKSGGRKVVLFALQPGDWPTIEGAFKPATLTETIMSWLSELPEGWAACITCRVGMYFPPSLEKQLESEWPNLIFLPRNMAHMSSEFLMPELDAVATISSTVGIHAYLWGKTLAAFGDSNLAALGNNRLSDLDKVQPAPVESRMALLRFLTFRYIHTLESLTADGSYLSGWLKRWKDADYSPDFFLELDNWEISHAVELLNPVQAEDVLKQHYGEFRFLHTEITRLKAESESLLDDITGDYDSILIPRCIPWGSFQAVLKAVRKIFRLKKLSVLEANKDNLDRYEKGSAVIPYRGDRFTPRRMRDQLESFVDCGKTAVIIPINNEDGRGFEHLIDFALLGGFRSAFIATRDGKLTSLHNFVKANPGLFPVTHGKITHGEGDETSDSGGRAYLDRVFKTAIAHLKLNGMALNIGGGYGASLLADRASHVYAVEDDPNSLSLARFHYANEKISFTFGSAERLLFRDDVFDLVTQIDDLEKLEFPELSVGEVHRVLKPGGYYVATVPVESNPDCSAISPGRFSEERFRLLLESYFEIKLLEEINPHRLIAVAVKRIYTNREMENDRSLEQPEVGQEGQAGHNPTSSFGGLLLNLDFYASAAERLPGMRVLDAACGTGFGARLMRLRGAAEVLGLDGDPNNIDYANRNHKIDSVHFQVAEAGKPPESLGKFDAAVRFQAPGKAKGLRELLTGLNRVVRPGGLIILSSRADRPPGAHETGNNLRSRFISSVEEFFDIESVYSLESVSASTPNGNPEAKAVHNETADRRAEGSLVVARIRKPSRSESNARKATSWKRSQGKSPAVGSRGNRISVLPLQIERRLKAFLRHRGSYLGKTQRRRVLALAAGKSETAFVEPDLDIGRPAGPRLVCVADPLDPYRAELLRSQMGPDDTLVVIGSEQTEFDVLKDGLFDHGSMGGCSVTSSSHLWWGGTRQQPSCPELEEGRSLPVVLSFYTIGTPYEDEAKNLESSLLSLGLEHRIVGIAPRESWEENCALKADFVLESWNKLGKPVLWVDADAIFHRLPTLLSDATSDFAIHKVYGWQFSSGTLFFNSTENAEKLLRKWAERSAADPLTWDQIHLDLAWEDTVREFPLETLWLPQAYTRIYDWEIDPGEDHLPVIEHHQASRRFKADVSGGQVRPQTHLKPEHKAARKYCRPR